jgi:hypothetical protein
MKIEVPCHVWDAEYVKIQVFAKSRLGIIEDRVRLEKTEEYERPPRRFQWNRDPEGEGAITMEDLQHDLERTRAIVDQIKEIIAKFH